MGSSDDLTALILTFRPSLWFMASFCAVTLSALAWALVLRFHLRRRALWTVALITLVLFPLALDRLASWIRVNPFTLEVVSLQKTSADPTIKKEIP